MTEEQPEQSSKPSVSTDEPPQPLQMLCRCRTRCSVSSPRLLFSGARRPRAARRLLGAGWLSSGGRGRQPTERGVRRGRPAEQPTHADQRRERLQDPPSPIHSHTVLQGPLLQLWVLRGEAQIYCGCQNVVGLGLFCFCFFTSNKERNPQT